MLPLIKININEIYFKADNLISKERDNIVVQTFAYNVNDLLVQYEKKKENADQLFTRAILYGIMSKQPKSKIIFFYSPHSEYTFISIALHKLNSNFFWLQKIPGYCEWGQEYLKENARPFLYWDGNNLHRIYFLPEYKPATRYITDFGSLYGLLSSETDEQTYKRIKLNEDGKAWDYSIVPDMHDEIVTVKDNKLVLLHSRYELIT